MKDFLNIIKKKRNKLIFLIYIIIFIVTHCILFNLDRKELYLKNTIKEEVQEDINVENVTVDKNLEIMGYISIPSIKLENAPVKDGTELSILATAVGHFKNTSYYDGNICFAGHNVGTNSLGQDVGFFKNLKDIKPGDNIIYNNLYYEKTYLVSEIKEVEETDLSVLNNNKNQVTLITCIHNTPTKRLCVIAEEKNI